MEKQTKRGRKANHYRHSVTDKQIYGLGRTGNRWRIIASNTFFSAPDEDSAIQKYYRLTGQAIKEAALESTLDDSGATTEAGVARIGATSGVHFNGYKALWKWVTEQINTRPKYVAKMTGREEIGYLNKLEKPEAVPTFAALRKMYLEGSTAQKDEVAKVLRSWDLFSSKIFCVEDITPKSAVAFADYFFSLKQSDKSAFHCFNAIRRIFTFAISKAVAMDELKRRLEYLKLMKPAGSPNSESNPNPLTKEEWQQLLAAATEPQDKALLLLCLNGAYTLGEAITLKWEDIKDGCIVSHRKKKGKVIRACVLWKETIEAIDAIPNKKAQYLFTAVGTKIHRSTAERRFNLVADNAKLPQITGSQMRDSAQTAATQANISERLVDIMAGHKAIGITDKYIARNPQIVKPATDAVYVYYFK